MMGRKTAYRKGLEFGGMIGRALKRRPIIGSAGLISFAGESRKQQRKYTDKQRRREYQSGVKEGIQKEGPNALAYYQRMLKNK